MFELWFGARLAPFAVPVFASMTLAGMALVIVRPPKDKGAESVRQPTATR